MPKRVDHPIILGIVGDSASGKTTLSAGVAQILGEEHCSVFCTDDYHSLYAQGAQRRRPVRARPARQLCRRPGAAFAPAARGRAGPEAGLLPHGTARSAGREYFKPTEFVIAEGLLGYTTRAMRDCYDVKIYLDPEEDLRIKWKIHRDTTKRGYKLEEVVASLERRKQDSPNFIHPQRTFADIVIRFQSPQERWRQWLRYAARRAASFAARHCRIPDFTPLFDGQQQCGPPSRTCPR